MKFLLDTHTFLWTLFGDEHLSRKSVRAIQDLKNEIYVSVITYWEISLKYSIGRLELGAISPDQLPTKAKEADIRTVQVSERQAASYYTLPKLKHKDPFDRLIIWQAICSNLTLITKDQEMRNYIRHGLEILW